MCDINGILAARGILAVAERAGWQQHTLVRDGSEYSGWSFPVLNAHGQPHPKPRWKNSNGHGPKYDWPQKQPPNAKYYFLTGLRTAIETAGGTLYLAAGEPDVLTYHAAGIQNVLCWFNGEKAIPTTLAADLKYLGVSHVIYAPDRDNTGMRSAAKLVELLRDTAITYQIAQLPGELGSKADINQTWIDCGFDAGQFWGAVWAEEIDDTTLALYAGVTGKTDDETGQEIDTLVKGWRDEWVNLIKASMGPPATTEGGIGRWHCPLPGHEDKHPSFRWADFWPMCSCSIQDDKRAVDRVAEARNIEPWADFKRRKASEAGYTPGSQRAPQRDPITGKVEPERPLFVNMADVYIHLADVIQGRAKPTSRPIRQPYTVLRKFGGFCNWSWTGKAVALGGFSGGGKTLLLRVIALALISAGHDVAWWGPEWSPDEYGMQDLIRMGGLSFDQVNNLMAIYWHMQNQQLTLEEAMRVTDVSLPTQAERDKSEQILLKLAAKPGQLHIIADSNIPVDKAMQDVNKWAAARRADGGDPVGLFWDYLQLSNAPGGGDWKWGNLVAGQIKAGCSYTYANLVAYMSTQSRKNDAQRARQQHERLDISAFQGLDESIFNLAITITPGLSEDGEKLDWAALTIGKNSMGRAGGSVAVPVDWSRLVMMDEEYPVNLQAYFDRQKQEA